MHSIIRRVAFCAVLSYSSSQCFLFYHLYIRPIVFHLQSFICFHVSHLLASPLFVTLMPQGSSSINLINFPCVATSSCEAVLYVILLLSTCTALHMSMLLYKASIFLCFHLIWLSPLSQGWVISFIRPLSPFHKRL
jgi:hypothetical protein